MAELDFLPLKNGFYADFVLSLDEENKYSCCYGFISGKGELKEMGENGDKYYVVVPETYKFETIDFQVDYVL